MIERLKLLIEYYNLSASSFADKIDVPRSSISHLLSGRNRPSLDFVMKVVEAFEEVELNWIVYGKGKFPVDKLEEELIEEPKIQEVIPDLFSEVKKNDEIKEIPKPIKKIQVENLPTENNSEPVIVQEKKNTQFSRSEKKLMKIVLLYNDGTFDEYKN